MEKTITRKGRNVSCSETNLVPSTLEAFIKQEHKTLLLYANKILFSSSLYGVMGPEDLLHEVIARAVARERAGKVVTETALHTYFYRAMKNLLIDLLRREKVLNQKQVYVRIEEVESEKFENTEVFFTETFSKIVQAVRKELALFSHTERSVFVLRYYNGCSFLSKKILTFKKIGNILGLDINCVMSAHRRGIVKLRKSIQL